MAGGRVHLSNCSREGRAVCEMGGGEGRSCCVRSGEWVAQKKGIGDFTRWSSIAVSRTRYSVTPDSRHTHSQVSHPLFVCAIFPHSDGAFTRLSRPLLLSVDYKCSYASLANTHEASPNSGRVNAVSSLCNCPFQFWLSEVVPYYLFRSLPTALDTNVPVLQLGISRDGSRSSPWRRNIPRVMVRNFA